MADEVNFGPPTAGQPYRGMLDMLAGMQQQNASNLQQTVPGMWNALQNYNAPAAPSPEERQGALESYKKAILNSGLANKSALQAGLMGAANAEEPWNGFSVQAGIMHGMDMWDQTQRAAQEKAAALQYQDINERQKEYQQAIAPAMQMLALKGGMGGMMGLMKTTLVGANQYNSLVGQLAKDIYNQRAKGDNPATMEEATALAKQSLDARGIRPTMEGAPAGVSSMPQPTATGQQLPNYIDALGQNLAGETAAAQGAQTPEEQAAHGESVKQLMGLINRLPPALKTQALRWVTQAATVAGTNPDLAQRRVAQINGLVGGVSPGGAPSVGESAPTPVGNVQYSKDLAARSSKYEGALQQNAEAAGQTLNALDMIEQHLDDLGDDAGKLADFKQKLAAWQIALDPKGATPEQQRIAKDVVAADKSAFGIAVSKMRQFSSRATQMELMSQLKNLPNSGLTPETNKAMLADLRAPLQSTLAQQADYNQWRQTHNPAQGALHGDQWNQQYAGKQTLSVPLPDGTTAIAVQAKDHNYYVKKPGGGYQKVNVQ